MSIANRIFEALLPSPLCREYSLVLFADLWESGNQGRCHCGPCLRWGLGVLSDGQQEFLGVWKASGAAGADWHAIAFDLKLRGVEKIRSAAGTDRTGIANAMRETYPEAALLPAPESFSERPHAGAVACAVEKVRQPNPSERRHRRSLDMARDKMVQMNQLLQRAMQGRRWTYGTESVAMFIGRVLGDASLSGGSDLGRSQPRSRAILSSKARATCA